jgi:hypothetical protein
MTEYHDRSVDDPHPAEDRRVAGWPDHEPDQQANGTPGGEEPLVGEVWNEDSSTEGAGQRTDDHAGGTGRPGEDEGQGEHAQTDEAAESQDLTEHGEDTGHDHVSEPFGTEEPMIVSDSAAEGSDVADAERTDPEGSDVLVAERTDADPATESAVEPTGEPTGEPVVITDAAAPAAETETVPEAEPVVDGARPTAADELTVDDLFEPEAAERFRDRWRDVKAVFVDDPSDAVRQASALSGEAVDELTAALGRLRETLDGHWDEGKQTDTERLRVALRGYGSLIDRILAR